MKIIYLNNKSVISYLLAITFPPFFLISYMIFLFFFNTASNKGDRPKIST